MTVRLQASVDRLRRMNWTQMAAAGLSPAQAAAVRGCSVGRATDMLRSAHGILATDTSVRLAEGSFEAAAAECGLQLITVAVPETKAQCLMPRSEIDRLSTETLAVQHEGLMQQMYSRQPVPDARDSRGRLLPGFESEYTDRRRAA